MYCPKCGCEYREGFFECSDCKIPLLSGKAPEEKIESVRFKEVTTNLKQDEISIIKSILEARGIIYHIQGESFSTIHPWISGTVRLLVQETQFEETLELLQDFM